MPIPDFQSLMLPLLRFASDGQPRSLEEARERLATQFELTQEERDEFLDSGRQRRFDNRVAWARKYLQWAGVLASPRRGYFAITDRGRALLADAPQRIDIAFLDQFEEFRRFRAGNGVVNPAPDPDPQLTPEEAIERGHKTLQANLMTNLHEKVHGMSPSFFEKLVVDLLRKMGYGGDRVDAGRAIGASGDEGIDGIIDQDRLGLDTIYVQAKRWEATVGRPEIQKFVGALHGKRARKGVFITTSAFSADAIDYASHIDPKVILIDGRQLVQYMFDYGLGVSTRVTYEVKRIDSDYFTEE